VSPSQGRLRSAFATPPGTITGTGHGQRGRLGTLDQAFNTVAEGCKTQWSICDNPANRIRNNIRIQRAVLGQYSNPAGCAVERKESRLDLFMPGMTVEWAVHRTSRIRTNALHIYHAT
jgi:hypothetical protein